MTRIFTSEENIVSIHKQIQLAKIKGKSRDYIACRIKRLGCPNGRKNCGVCSSSLGKSLNKGKGKNKRTLEVKFDDY